MRGLFVCAHSDMQMYNNERKREREKEREIERERAPVIVCAPVYAENTRMWMYVCMYMWVGCKFVGMCMYSHV